MFAQPLTRLIEELNKLPGVGKKSAARIAFYIVNSGEEQVNALSRAMIDAKKEMRLCDVCQNLTDVVPCSICSSQKRDRTKICVTEGPRDIISIEKTHEYHGLYHCLHGAISPLEGIGPSNLKIKELTQRLTGDDVKEVILATNSTVEGEATAMYIAKLIKPFGIRVTRLAHGIPVGGDLEFADQITLARALEGRREV